MEHVRQSISQLPPGQRSVLDRRTSGQSLQEIADCDGVTVEAVRQVEAEAINDLSLAVGLRPSEVREALGLMLVSPEKKASVTLADLEPKELGLSLWTLCVLADEGVLTMQQLLTYAFNPLAEFEAELEAVTEIRETILSLDFLWSED